ncbi:MAG: hypothetical protein V1789_02455 [PVC group bacterium]
MSGQKGIGRERYGAPIYFAVLLLALLVFFLPSFDNPPRSDYWSAFYVFQQVEASPLPPNWPSILTFDLWQHGTYRPFSHLILYLEHLLFSPHFVWNHILNFSAYFLAVILLYLLAGRLALDRVLTAALLAVFAFLFSHFDILTWTFQIFSVLAFCAFLLGFILFIDHLRSRRPILLVAVGILFLFGMLCSEVYALWPLAIFILPFALSSSRPYVQCQDATPVLVYLFYLGGFILHRAGTVTTGPLPAITPGLLVSSFLMVFFNLLYNGIVVNICPFLAVPLFYNDNINLGGILWRWEAYLDTLVPWLGLAAALLLGAGGFLLWRIRKRRTLALLSFFFYLYFTNLFTVAAARLTTDPIFYPLSQFRYQYVPNALLALMAAAVLGGLLRTGRRGKLFICLILLPVLVFNITLIHKQMLVLENRLRPLRVILDNISRGIDGGLITEDDRLFIEKGVAEKLPAPAWNNNMERFMEGSLQWFYPASEMKKFTFFPEDAAWIIRQDDYLTIQMTREHQDQTTPKE